MQPPLRDPPTPHRFWIDCFSDFFSLSAIPLKFLATVTQPPPPADRCRMTSTRPRFFFFYRFYRLALTRLDLQQELWRGSRYLESQTDCSPSQIRSHSPKLDFVSCPSIFTNSLDQLMSLLDSGRFFVTPPRQVVNQLGIELVFSRPQNTVYCRKRIGNILTLRSIDRSNHSSQHCFQFIFHHGYSINVGIMNKYFPMANSLCPKQWLFSFTLNIHAPINLTSTV